MKKKLVSLLVCIFIVSQGFSQLSTGTIKGRILDMNKNPLPGAVIKLENSVTGTVSDANGYYTLDKVPTGKQKVFFSFLGFQEVGKKILVQQGINELSDVILNEEIRSLDQVVITATRTETDIENVPVPLQIISKEEIRNIGATRLNEVLLEQTGLLIDSDHGTGLQIQGFAADYALILIDGEPVIGRTAGTLDLSRIAVNNIERIEIVKGPTSSLYGSEAMAGVVNIITKRNLSPFSVGLQSRYRTNNTLDFNSSVASLGDKLGVEMNLDYLRSDGYDLTPNTISNTAPEFNAYTIQPKISYKFSQRTNLAVSARYYHEEQENRQEINDEQESFIVNDQGLRKDYAINTDLTHTFNARHKLRLRNYFTKYETESELNYQNDGTLYNFNFFDQSFNRTELQYDAAISATQSATLGAGFFVEEVEATRYENVNQFTASYAFAQYQWAPLEKFNIVAGARFDQHSEYSSQLSPKLAVQYRFNEKLKVQASAGAGYKAPDFRQLLLNFTNPVVGYSVFGSSVVREGIRRLEAEGRVDQILIDPDNINEIKSESSWSFNLGWEWNPLAGKDFRIKANLFRNNINDLIETAPVVRKTNGQNVFSYFNFDEVITQGVEAEMHYRPLNNLSFSLGYQYLDTRDVEMLNELKNGKIFASGENGTFRLDRSDYRGLFNRSRHSGNIKVNYHLKKLNMDFSVRGIYTGEFGVADTNVNGVYDAYDLTADDNLLWNGSIQKFFRNGFALETGVRNILDRRNQHVPTMPGRILFGGFSYQFSKQ